MHDLMLHRGACRPQRQRLPAWLTPANRSRHLSLGGAQCGKTCATNERQSSFGPEGAAYWECRPV